MRVCGRVQNIPFLMPEEENVSFSLFSYFKSKENYVFSFCTSGVRVCGRAQYIPFLMPDEKMYNFRCFLI